MAGGDAAEPLQAPVTRALTTPAASSRSESSRSPVPTRATTTAFPRRGSTGRDPVPTSKEEEDKGEVNKFKAQTSLNREGQKVISQVCLADVKLFKECSAEFVAILKESLEAVIFQAGADIIVQGDIGECMYILVRGKVDVIVKETTVCTLGDGSVFGEMAVITKNQHAAKRTATIRAKEACVCRSINRDALMGTLHRFPVERAIFEKMAAARLADLVAKGVIPGDAKGWRDADDRDTAQRRESARANWGRAARLSALNTLTSATPRRHSVGSIAFAAVAHTEERLSFGLKTARSYAERFAKRCSTGMIDRDPSIKSLGGRSAESSAERQVRDGEVKSEEDSDDGFGLDNAPPFGEGQGSSPSSAPGLPDARSTQLSPCSCSSAGDATRRVPLEESAARSGAYGLQENHSDTTTPRHAPHASSGPRHLSIEIPASEQLQARSTPRGGSPTYTFSTPSTRQGSKQSCISGQALLGEIMAATHAQVVSKQDSIRSKGSSISKPSDALLPDARRRHNRQGTTASVRSNCSAVSRVSARSDCSKQSLLPPLRSRPLLPGSPRSPAHEAGSTAVEQASLVSGEAPNIAPSFDVLEAALVPRSLPEAAEAAAPKASTWPTDQPSTRHLAPVTPQKLYGSPRSASGMAPRPSPSEMLAVLGLPGSGSGGGGEFGLLVPVAPVHAVHPVMPSPMSRRDGRPGRLTTLAR